MALEFRKYSDSDLVAMQRIWNEVVCAGDAFPGEQPLSLQECRSYFAAQTCTTLAVLDGRVAGLYILHPNNIGRAAHIANASYAVDSAVRGQHVYKRETITTMATTTTITVVASGHSDLVTVIMRSAVFA